MKIVYITVIFFVGIATSYAQLEWKDDVLSFSPKLNEKSVEAVFEFKNGGNDPVTINEIKTSCGCTTAQLSKREYQPGEVGEVKVLFNLGARTGFQKKYINIKTNDSSVPEVKLTMKVDIPQVLKISPAFVYWKAGQQPDEKRIKLTVVQDVPVHLTYVTATDENFTTKLETIKEGKEYEIVIKPLQVNVPVSKRISITTDYPKAKPKKYKVYASIK